MGKPPLAPATDTAPDRPSGGKPPLPQVIADMMLGKLAKWLRIAGADARYENPIDDDALLELARVERRLLLTRDTRFVRRAGSVPTLFIRHDALRDQLVQVAGEYDFAHLTPFSRCLRCNVPVEQVEKESVRGRLWPYVYATQSEISKCPECGRLYWPATHRGNAMERLKEMLGGSPWREV